MAYHINAKGEPGVCRAHAGGCPFGGENEHYDTADDARRAYEKVQEGTAWGSVSKAVKPTTPGARPLPSAAERAAEEKARDAKAFAAADYEWRSAVALWEDETAIHTLTGERLSELAAARDAIAARVGAPTSQEVKRQAKLQRAEAVASEVQQAIERVETLARGTASPKDDEARRQLAYGAQRGYERALTNATYVDSLLKAGQAGEEPRLRNAFVKADLEARIAKAKYDQVPDGSRFRPGSRERKAEVEAEWTQAHEARRQAYADLREVSAEAQANPILPVY